MTWLEAVIIAIVEGLTEYLPVSSTGHMMITQAILGVKSDDFVKLFTVNIQFGAILAVVVLYWKRFLQSLEFYYKLLIAFIPAAIIGLIFGDQIDMLLENVTVVAYALLIGGIILLFVDKLFEHNEQNKVGYYQSFIIGVFQCIALIPGVSRSAATIIGGMTMKLNRKTAAEFSFFLAVPTMFAASAYKLLKASDNFPFEHIDLLILGNVVAFLVAIIAIKSFLHILLKYGFRAFGYYRIALGLILLELKRRGVPLEII